jgi:hypothetical protein
MNPEWQSEHAGHGIESIRREREAPAIRCSGCGAAAATGPYQKIAKQPHAK